MPDRLTDPADLLAPSRGLAGSGVRRFEATAVVLAGGRSRRMGRDKGSLVLEGETLLARAIRWLLPQVEEVLVSGGVDPVAAPGARVVPDRLPGQGPMMAVSTCLQAASHDVVAFLPVDMPDPPLDLFQDLLARASPIDRPAPDVVLARTERFWEPLFGVYRKSCLPALDRMLAAGERRILDLYPLVEVEAVPIPVGLPNVNTPAEWDARARRRG